MIRSRVPIRQVLPLAFLVAGIVSVAVPDSVGGPDQGFGLFVGIWGVIGLIPVLLAVRSSRRGCAGDAKAWNVVALPGELLAWLLALHLLHPSMALGLQQCDEMAGPCGAAPLPFFIPAALFLGSAILTRACLRGHAGTAPAT